MKRAVPVLSFALLAACAVPAAAGDEEPPVRRAREGRPPRAAAESPAPRVSAEAEAWLRTLAERIADPDPLVARSAAEGIAAAGRAALPVLGKMAGSEDRETAARAMRLIARIETGGRRGPGGRPGADDRPGTGHGRRPGKGPGAEAPFRGGRDGRRGPGAGFGPPEGGPGPGRGPGRESGPPDGLRGPRPGRGPGSGPPGATRRPDGGPGLESLDLTPEQRERLEAFREEHRAKVEETMRRLREENPGPEEVRAARERLREEMKTALESILTPEQRERLDGMRERRGPPPGRGPRPAGPPPGGAR